MKSIYLVGFMGCGKSAVGAELAIRLGRSFIDLDREIESTTQRSIGELIAERGEKEFRQIESEALRLASARELVVVATGGGIILNPINRKVMSESGVTIWLDVPFELCWERIASDGASRPLAPDRQSALSRYSDRLDYYRESDLRVEIPGAMPVETVAAMIVEKVLDRDHNQER